MMTPLHVRRWFSDHWRPSTLQFQGISGGVFLVLLGLPIVLNSLPDPAPEVPLYFAQPTVWPLDHLTAAWFGVACLTSGCLLLFDAASPLPRRWQRTAVWGLGWLLVTNVWLFVCLALSNGPRGPWFSWASGTSLWLGYTMVLFGGLPLRGAREDA